MFGKRVRQLRADHVAFHALHQVKRRADHAGVIAKEQRPWHGHGSGCQRAHDPILALDIVRRRHQRTARGPPQYPVRGAAIDEEGLVRVPAANALDLQRGVAVRQPLGKVTLQGLRIDQGRKSAHRCPSLLWRLARRRRCPVRARSLLATVYAARQARARPLSPLHESSFYHRNRGERRAEKGDGAAAVMQARSHSKVPARQHAAPSQHARADRHSDG